MSDFFFVFLIIVLLFSVFRRYIFYAIMRAVSKRLFDHAQRMQNNQRGYQHTAEEGKVKVEVKEPQQRSNLDNTGEYVDFEELKD